VLVVRVTGGLTSASPSVQFRVGAWKSTRLGRSPARLSTWPSSLAGFLGLLGAALSRNAFLIWLFASLLCVLVGVYVTTTLFSFLARDPGQREAALKTLRVISRVPEPTQPAGPTASTVDPADEASGPS